MDLILTVGAEARYEPRLRLGVATLPESFRYADSGSDVVGLVGGRHWVEGACAAVRLGARGILVADPTVIDIDPLLAATGTAGPPVVLDRGWESSPGAAYAAPHFARLLTPAAILESRVDAPSGSELTSVLLRQLALVRATAGPLSTLQLIRHNRTGYDAAARLSGGTRVSLAAIFSDALTEAATVRVVQPTSTIHLELGPIGSAAPASLRVLEDGTEAVPVLPFETPHRVAWRRLHQAVHSNEPLSELQRFAQDVALVRSAVEVG